MAAGLTGLAGGVFTKGFGFIFRLRLMFFFILFIFINSVIIGVEAGSVDVVLDDLGNRFLSPTLKIQEFSLEVIENQGFYQSTPKVWGGLWNVLFDLWGVGLQFYIIMIWLSVLAWIMSISPFSDKSRTFTNWCFAIFFFFVIQVLYLLITGKGDFLTPFYAFRDLFRALPFIVKPIAAFGDTISNSPINVSNGTNFSV